MMEEIKYKCTCGVDTAYGIYKIIEHGKIEFIINSCCGGCWSANNIHYCPYCGDKLK